MWGTSRKNGLDFDIIYIATTSFDIDELRDDGIVVEDPGKIKFSIGYRRTF
jgi:hypothetical protein